MPLQTGDTLLKGQYRILGRIGQGGFAFVYHARDTLLGRDVAIKELVPTAGSDPKWVKRFFVEARATLDLHHDHIVSTQTLFAESGNHYLVMEYMPSGSLEDLLRKTYRLPVDDAVRIAREVCEGLSYAHHRGIVHCDLKPANILFAASGTAKVADFGIAHVSSHGVRSQHWATTGHFVAGTLKYMSPEQVEGERSDPRNDLYALGALLYHVLTGRPYADFGDSATPASIGHNLDLIRHHQLAPPSTHNSLVPTWLDDLVLRLLAKRPGGRPDTASDVLGILDPAVSAPQLLPAGPFLSLRQHLPTWAKFVALGVLLVILLGVALASLFGDWGPVLATPKPTVTVPASTVNATPTPMPTPMAAHTLTPTTEPLLPHDGGRIAFASGAGDTLQICVVNVDDRSRTCLTDNGFLNESPAWSPDGKRLAFHFTVSNCVLNMISPKHYERFLLRHDQMLSREFDRFGVHTCEWDVTPYLGVLRRIQKVGYLDMGSMSDMKRARRMFPDARGAVLLGPTILSLTMAQMRPLIERIYAELAPCDVVIGSIDSSVPDERFLQYIRLVEDVASQPRHI